MWFFPSKRIQSHFDGKTVWITGASSGIGAALSRELASRGARLVLSARRTDRLHQVRAECAHPERHRVVPLDLGEVRRLEAAARTVLAKGPVDILIHNAGISQRSLALDTDLRVVRQLLEINFLGTVALNGAVVPSMVENGGGQVAVITSVLGRIGIPMRSAYAASKHALHGYFECLRAEIHSSGISVALVCPGFVSTEISLHALTAKGGPNGRQSQEQLEGLSPESCAREIAKAIAHRRPEALVGGSETWGVPLFRWLPGLFRLMMRRRTVRDVPHRLHMHSKLSPNDDCLHRKKQQNQPISWVNEDGTRLAFPNNEPKQGAPHATPKPHSRPFPSHRPVHNEHRAGPDPGAGNSRGNTGVGRT